jgi:hypothetical protein
MPIFDSSAIERCYRERSHTPDMDLDRLGCISTQQGLDFDPSLPFRTDLSQGQHQSYSRSHLEGFSRIPAFFAICAIAYVRGEKIETSGFDVADWLISKAKGTLRSRHHGHQRLA